MFSISPPLSLSPLYLPLPPSPPSLALSRSLSRALSRALSLARSLSVILNRREASGDPKPRSNGIRRHHVHAVPHAGVRVLSFEGELVDWAISSRRWFSVHLPMRSQSTPLYPTFIDTLICFFSLATRCFPSSRSSVYCIPQPCHPPVFLLTLLLYYANSLLPRTMHCIPSPSSQANARLGKLRLQAFPQTVSTFEILYYWGCTTILAVAFPFTYPHRFHSVLATAALRATSIYADT